MKKPDMTYPYLKLLLYGQPGATKTRTAATATFHDEFSPVLILESAGNPIAIRDYEPAPVVLSMETLKDYNVVYDYLVNGQPEVHAFRGMCLKAGIELPDYFKTVVLDGTTQIQRFALDVIVPGSDVAPGDIPAAYEYQHFNKVLNTMVNFAEKFIRNLDMHVILTALEDEHAEKSGATKIRPLIWGQSRGEICGFAYLVMRLAPVETIDVRSKSVFAMDMEEAKASDFVGFMRATNSFYAKDQYGMRDDDGELMRYMFDPTIEKIWERIAQVVA